ncbi:aldo/keto reductase [Loigolactobacillus backii]|uniref:Glyoxal reductase n=1 Tax=Loigolactobacillus backii TaxID=375175 RepID=A0A192GZU4_9LACO|nr:aldo/keto reductase [Loigolactobacillus backii]ANK60443.1 glyoxal reductase [Loigolactobacillus backii]ANK62059.1 glyoxal reductase [Loigolactobacillus backii]ANK65322.1 glyoxal reductase [Loigolactobacillus backii]ANK67873.1 glyoxal reductase [Loigolactobacillus backii]ANK68747.1 glyoxal reductase [Loigolactobacillus backii]
MNNQIPNVTLNNGVKIPQLGLGVFLVKDANELKQSIKWALAADYRHIDTAMIYENETTVGEAIKESKLDRKDLFITSKLWNSDHGYEETKAAFNASLKRLGVDYLDMYLIHWPSPNYIESWKAMEELYHAGKIRAIGVSNFQIHHLEDLMAHTEVVPVVNQIETHPYFQQKELHDFMAKHNIAHEAWGPLGQGKGNVLNDPTLTELAKKHAKSTAQIILRWHVQRGEIVIPKSIHENRIQQNRDIFDFSLSDEEMAKIAAIDKNQRGSRSPDDTEWLEKTAKE